MLGILFPGVAGYRYLYGHIGKIVKCHLFFSLTGLLLLKADSKIENYKSEFAQCP